jgi:serum/glucocorticoid-regulated kinase 3
MSSKTPTTPARTTSGGAEASVLSPVTPTELAGASVADFETVKEDKRFTLYQTEFIGKDAEKCVVFRRYSEFRDLYEALCKAFPRDKDKFKFPKKRFVGSNFDEVFLQSRRKGLHEFVQVILGDVRFSGSTAVMDFFFSTPRHGRGPKYTVTPSDTITDEDKGKGGEGGSAATPFDLGETASKAKASDFEMIKVIGKGSFGKVLLGKHTATGTIYAVKVLSKEAIVKQNEVKHIMSERNVLLGNVHHPFLIGLRYSFQTSTKLYFVLDYVNGGELFFHLQRVKRFDVPRALFYAAEITSALGYMHRLNIVYRDLKPENILLDSQGHIVLTDFGLCKENVPVGGTTSTFCGTPEYLAPEVLKKHAYGRPVDWWCLGCVTFEMMCGLPPFYSRDCNEMYDRILHDKLRFPDHVPPLARSLLEGLLVRIPDQRLGGGPADAQAVKAHPFFAEIDWDKLDRKEIEPPFNPGVSDALDLHNFDPEFTAEPVPGSLMPGQQQSGTPGAGVTISQVTDAFDGFSFRGHANAAPDAMAAP